MTNDRPVYILPLINHNAYWLIIGYLYCMTLFFISHYKLLNARALDSQLMVKAKERDAEVGKQTRMTIFMSSEAM